MLIDIEGREIYVGGRFYNTAGHDLGEVVKIEGCKVVANTPDGPLRIDLLTMGGHMMEPLDHSSPEVLKADIDASLAGWFCGMQFSNRRGARREDSTCDLSSPFFKILRSKISDEQVRIDMKIHFDDGHESETKGVLVKTPSTVGVLCATKKNSGLQSVLSGSVDDMDRKRDDILRKMFGG